MSPICQWPRRHILKAGALLAAERRSGSVLQVLANGAEDSKKH